MALTARIGSWPQANYERPRSPFSAEALAAHAIGEVARLLREDVEVERKLRRHAA